MLNGKLERDMVKINQYWNEFIILVKKDIDKLNRIYENDMIDFKRLGRIVKILEHDHNDIDFLLFHKESLLWLDKDLESKFLILEAFKKRNNLDNAVAIRTCKEILDNRKIKEITSILNNLRIQIDNTKDLLASMNDLVLGRFYSKELLLKLIDDYKLDGEFRNAILIYPIIKTLKVNVEEKKEEVLVTDDEIVINDNVLENPDYKDKFNSIKKEYEKIRSMAFEIVNKYHSVLINMKPTEAQYYRVFCSLDDDKLKEKFSNKTIGEYDEVLAKIFTINILDLKEQIDSMVKKIVLADYNNKEDVDAFENFVNQFKEQYEKLVEVDKRIVKVNEEKELFKNSNIFFLTDRIGNPLIPDVVKSNKDGLINMLLNVQSNKDNSTDNIKPLKIHDKKFKEEVNRTIFSVVKGKMIFSYINLKNGIMILTASLMNPNTIQSDTDRVIKENREQIIRQIVTIEKNDPHQLSVQSLIREELLDTEEVLEEGEVDGRQVK